MRNLIVFLWKNHFFFLFLVLEAIALFLLFNNNYYQRRAFINTTNDFTGQILLVYDNVSDYFTLKEANETLALENSRYRNLHPEAFQKIDTNTVYVDDTLYDRQYRYISSRVISNSVNRRNNYLKLNKGKIQGLEPDMGVIAPNGVVGQVIEVSDHFSSVMSILNSQARISAKLKTSNQVGSLFWDGEDYRMGKLVDIPSHVQFSIGDTIITSGYSFIYPEGEMIGVVDNYAIEPGDNFFTIDVKFAVDYNKIHHVYVVKNLFAGELRELENQEIQ